MKKLICLLTALILMLSLSACNDTPDISDTTHLALVLGVRKCFPAISLSDSTLNYEVLSCSANEGTCTIVAIDGNPAFQSSFTVEKCNKQISSRKRIQLAENNASKILSLASQTRAAVPQADTLKAIGISAEYLKSAYGSGKRTMLIADSGISTSGLLDFSSENLFESDSGYIVSRLEEKHAIPDLSDIEVIWIGIGQTAGEQAALTEEYKFNLTKIWQAILSAGNAQKITFVPGRFPSYEAKCELPEVTAIPIVHESIKAGIIPPEIKFDENSSVKFLGDRSEFVDTAAAVEELRPIAAYLLNNPGQKMYIFGMTATHGNAEKRRQLSQERAVACKNALTGLGVPAEQIYTVGLGYSPNSLRVPDLDANGNLIEEQAKINRAVYFVLDSSPLVNSLTNFSA